MKAKLFLAAFVILGCLVLGGMAESDAVEPGDIYLYDAPTGTTICLSCPADPDGKYDDDMPKISGEKVLWSQSRTTGTLRFLYDIASGNVVEAPDGFVWETSPQKDGDLIVSTIHDRHDREIFLENKAQGTHQQLTENAVEDTFPCISGTAIAWVYGTGSNADIVLVRDETEYDNFLADGFDAPEPSDFSSSLVPPPNAYEDAFPNMKGDYLVWQRKVNGDWEIFLYDIGSGQAAAPITDNAYNDISPQTDGTYVTWVGYPGSGGDIFVYEIATGTTTVVTNNGAVDNPPQIADGRVVWASFDIVSAVSVTRQNGNTGEGSSGGGSCFVSTMLENGANSGRF